MTVRSAAVVAVAAVAGGFVSAQSTTTASSGTTFAAIAGYTPVSDVVEHSELDLDVANIETNADLLTEPGFAAAYVAYSEGGNSEKTAEIRTVQGFSTGAQEKLSGEATFDVWEAYWGSADYADQFTSAACLGTGAFEGASNLTRSEGCLKGAQYQNIWMYVTHELYDAVGDCEIGDLSANDGGPHAWDEGWAFYAGSLEGTAVGGSGDGQMIYALAEKRCENFGTCTGDSDGSDATGVSAINSELLTLWETGQANLLAGECTEASAVIEEILPLMAVPLMQGLLRYTYLADPAIGTGGDKEAAELWAFSAAILPWINACDAAVGTTVRDNTELGGASAPMADGYATIKAELESVYSCMGITCAQVGGLLDDTGAYYTDFEPCVDSTTTTDSATGTYADIAGYTPVSDVVEHSELDLDVADIETNADLETEDGLAAAYTAYSEGGNSEKTAEIRTVQGFSTGAEEKLSGEATFDVWEAYWGSPDYADQFTSAACQGTGAFEGAEMVTRSECCLKGAQYQNVWMYVTHELYDAVGDCEIGDLSANDGGPHAWDEGWAFYTGSLEGTAVGGSGDGQMLYALAEKRCENFGTCTGDSDGSDATGVSAINSELLDLWEDGKANLLAGQCTQASAVIEEILPLMAVPLIQGLLRYTYLADPAVGTGGDKEAAELWAFSAAILPWISACDAAVGTTVRDNTELGSASAPMADGYATIKGQLESVYSCMGITCAQVGGLLDDTGAYYTDFEPCVDSTTTTDSATGTYADIAGYTPGSDVVEHSELDLDVADIETNADLETEDGLAAAYTAYSEGGNSEKSTEIRTVQGFSTDADGKLTGEATFDVWEAYWGSPDYADQFTSAACQGTGAFEGAEMVTRSECCLKGAQYQNVWMYVTHELYDAVGDCELGDLSSNDGGPHAWDEGWAFYTGSLEGTAVGGSGDGQMLYALAEKRCENFGTCTGDSDGSDATGVSAINSELLTLWEAGKGNLLAGECTEASAVIEEIVPLMAVPLIQGLLRYTYLADPAIGTGGDKEAAELWAFSAAILPWISACDADVGTTVRDNTELGSASAPMADGYATIKGQLESVYSCMGITCAQVGGLLDDTGAYYTDFEPCVDSTTTTDSATGAYADIAGYTPGSDVVEHSELDLDVADIETNADLETEDGLAAAYTAYSEGGNSEKSTEIRTVQGFSTDADGKLTGEATFDVWEAYWGSPDYADQFTSAACQGTGAFEGAEMVTRSECCLKGAQYQNVWMYVTHELYDAVGDCELGDLSANDGGPHAWDEGWAFYTGSLEGTAVGGSGDGQMLYALAEKRCENFGTCTGDSDGSDATGVSAINSELLTLWEAGKGNLLAGECTEASAVIEEIVPLMAVPLIQGLLRYTYLADPAIGTGGDKEAAELWAFSAAILPWISACDADVGTTVRDNTELGGASAPMADGYATIKGQLESVYSCMGITCAQVGGLLDDTGAYYTDFEPCVDSTTTTDSATGTYADIAGYTPVSDVVEHSELDLDVADIETNADLETEDGLAAAYTAYSEGGNSEKTAEIRTVQGFSTDAQEKLSGEATFDVWDAYWGSPDYADQFTSAACQGTGAFEGAEMVTRSECCLKGAQYQNVWMYVTHELYDAVGDCEIGDLSANDGGPHAWDEGWAFYTGSLEGTAVGGSGDGQMLYALAEKRCENFGTCTGDSDGSDATGVSAINSELLTLWEAGKANLLAGECTEASAVIEEIVPLMAVPLIQGLLRYTYLADPAIGTGGDKEAAELWAFSAAILPWISSCDPAVGTAVRDNTELGSASAPMADGYATIKGQLESVYSCMGITCAQVGGLLDDTGAYYTDFEPCTDGATDSDSSLDSSDGSLASTDRSSDSGLDDGGIAGVTIGVIAAAAIGVAALALFKRRRKGAATVNENLGNF